MPSILHYTKPGDIVLDGFCGSGMTGVAAQRCGTASAEWRRDSHEPPEWGARKVILGDVGPAATFIAANYNIPFDVDEFASAAQRILDEVEDESGWMYETTHTDGKTKGRINYTVWSEVFTCPVCSNEVVFLEEALDKTTKRVRTEFPCGECGVLLKKRSLERWFQTFADPATGASWRRIKLAPVLIHYSLDKSRYEKEPDGRDEGTLDRVDRLRLPAAVRTNSFAISEMYHGSRLAPKGFTHAHHLFLPRSAQALAAL